MLLSRDPRTSEAILLLRARAHAGYTTYRLFQKSEWENAVQ